VASEGLDQLRAVAGGQRSGLIASRGETRPILERRPGRPSISGVLEINSSDGQTKSSRFGELL
jgi:hypothetical protein